MEVTPDYSLFVNNIDTNFFYKMDFEYHKHTLKMNKKFIMITYSEQNTINICDLNSFTILCSIDFEDSISFCNFHCSYETIFFVCIKKNVIVYQIDLNKKKIKLLSTIKGNFTRVIYADFSPFDSNLLFSVSKNHEIKIYDLTKNMPISHIFLDQPLDTKKKAKWNKTNMAVKLENDIISVFDYILFMKENVQNFILKDRIIDFYFYDSKYSMITIVLTEKNINLMYCPSDIKNIYKIDDIIIDNYYHQEKQIFIIFFRTKILGLHINYTYVENIFDIDIKKNNISYPIIFKYNENILNENELCRFYSLYSYIFNSYSITTNKYEDNKKQELLCESKNEESFRENIIKNISDIPLILSKKNNTDYNYILNKKYFEYTKIKTEMETIKKRHLFKRKQEVDINVNKINCIENIEDKYIFFLKLLINDNTNEKLIIKYLLFLKENQNQLKILYHNNIEDYENELNYYSNIINTNKTFDNFKFIKLGQDAELILFLNNLLKYDKNNLDKFEKYINNFEEFDKNLVLYNIPTEFQNKRFCYYGFFNLLKQGIKNLNNYIKEKKEVNINEKDEKLRNEEDNKILEEEFEKFIYKIKQTRDYILNPSSNLSVVEYLIILTINFSDKKEYDFGYNLITSQNLEEDDIKKFKNDKNNKKYNIKNSDNYKFICLNNLNLYSDDLYYSKKIYNYNYYKNKYNEKYEFSLMKQFYKNILPLKCFKSIYSTLYDDEYYPFEDKNFTNDFIEKYYHFLPMKNSETSGITDRFSMKMFILTFLPNAIGNNCKKSEQKILRRGYIINTSNHEIGHNFTSNNFYMNNARLPITTPRKNSLEFAEGGCYMEFALYGRIIETLNIQQALYIMNENNYNKTFLEFQEGFNDIKKEDIQVKGVFEESTKDINLETDIKKYNKNIYMPLKSTHLDEKIIVCKMKNDLIGRWISDKTYKKIYKKDD